MAIFKKSTRPSRSEAKPVMRLQGAPLPRKSETKITPDLQDGTLPYIERTKIRDEDMQEAQELKELRGDGGGGREEGQLALDVFQTAEEIVVVAPVAGVKSSDLSIKVSDEVLTIQGRRDFQFKTEPGDYFTRECFWGAFARSIILPESVDASAIRASFKNGVLTVKIPKVEKIRTRMVKIKEE